MARDKVKSFLWTASLAAAIAITCPPLPVNAQQRAAADTSNSEVAPTVQLLRRRMLEADVNALTFRSMDSLFTTRAVPRAGAVWNLPRTDQAPSFTYRFNGRTHDAEQFLQRTFTNALLIIKDGRIVSETYRNNSGPDTRFIGWSMTKSMTSVLIGCAVAEGLIASIDDQVVRYLPELRGGGYDGVTIRQILQMRSGIDYEERYDFDNPGIAARNHDSALVRNATRFADPARTIARLHPPGDVFQYKTLDTAVLGWLLERVSGGSVAAYTAQRLWEPLGAERDGFYIMDGPPGVGREFSGAGFNATLRDFGRFGQMVLDGGVADGRRIVPADWLRESTRPSAPENDQGGYGYQWWTMPNSDAFAAIGLQGQYIYIDPSSRTVVVKLSHFPPDAERADEETLAFMSAASAWTPRPAR